MKKLTSAWLFLVLLLGVSGLGYVVTTAGNRLAGDATGNRPEPVERVAVAHSTQQPSRSLSPAPSPRPHKKPRLRPGVRLMGADDTGPRIRDLQARFKQIGWFASPVDARFGPSTVVAVRGFQAKRRIPVTGVVDNRTLTRLRSMTRTPTDAELHNRATSSSHTSARLDQRCTTGRAMCIDKTSSTLRWVVDGTVHGTYAVRFGASYSPTRDGLFHVQSKSAAHVSRLYGSAMPWAMFFSGGQAVHYSSDFAARGYNGASHGCVNVRDYNGVRWLFGQVAIGDKVVVYRS